MKEYSTKDIRNVVLIGSAKSGKTTLSEAMLFEGKGIARRGTVEDKNTVSDNEEIDYGNRIYAGDFDGNGKDDFLFIDNAEEGTITLSLSR